MDLLRVIQTSHQAAVVALEDRIAKGVQPSLPFASLEFLFGAHWRLFVLQIICKMFLISTANIAYGLITILLYNYMQNRKEGFKLRPVIATYNLICVFLAAYVVYGLAVYKWKHPGKFVCNPLAVDEDAQWLAHFFWVFYIQKFWEFLDTFFFILRKSFRQVTFLHLYHHASITIVVGSMIHYDFSGDGYLPIDSFKGFNAFVHVLMYSHYFATTFGWNSWWRKSLTSLQLIQFVAITSQNIYSLYQGSQCGSPAFINVLLIGYMGTMLLLFGNFFVQRYLQPKPSAKKAQ